MPNKPHKHAKLIKAWADGAIIQYLSEPSTGLWLDCHNNDPAWDISETYRIKPNPKPDIIRFGEITAKFEDTRYNQGGVYVLDAKRVLEHTAVLPHHNIQVIFDGETRKLKRVEIINE